MFGGFKSIFYLVITFIIFLVVLILSGRILNLINLSSSACRSNSDIKTAHKWAAWAVGITSVGTGLTFLGIIGAIYLAVQTGGEV